jgi:hypothetical protein
MTTEIFKKHLNIANEVFDLALSSPGNKSSFIAAVGSIRVALAIEESERCDSNEILANFKSYEKFLLCRLAYLNCMKDNFDGANPTEALNLIKYVRKLSKHDDQFVAPDYSINFIAGMSNLHEGNQVEAEACFHSVIQEPSVMGNFDHLMAHVCLGDHYLVNGTGDDAAKKAVHHYEAALSMSDKVEIEVLKDSEIRLQLKLGEAYEKASCHEAARVTRANGISEYGRVEDPIILQDEDLLADVVAATRALRFTEV